MDRRRYDIAISVATRYLDEQSAPDEGRYVFAYTIRIANRGELPARLISRHWRITDASGKVEEVHGEGVVGEQPRLLPGMEFEYTSGAVLSTFCGRMQGHYRMRADDGAEFDAEIAPFALSIPRTLH